MELSGMVMARASMTCSKLAVNSRKEECTCVGDWAA